MARLSSYQQDGSLSGEDRLVGSSYEGPGQSGPVYKTRTYKLSELAAYFGGVISDGSGGLIDIVEVSQTVTDNTNAIATANQSITTITSDVLAQSTFQTNLAASFGTYDENGNLTSISQAHADQVLQATASDRYADAQFATNLAASVGTYDTNGNLITMSQAFADQVLQTTASDKYATSSFTTNLASSFGTYDQDGNILTLSSGFVDQVISSTSNEIESLSTFATNLASSFGTYDSNGNLLTLSSSFADDVISTANTAEFAQASAVQNLGASFGTVNPDGSVSFSNTSTYSNEILNYVDANSALATQVSNLETTVTNIPVTIRQPEPPDVNAYPLGSIWVDTDDSNAIYILVEGTPRTWQATTSEALGDLILSNAQLETEIELLSDNVSSQALKTQTLTAQFGVYDPATNTFTIDNNASVVSALRTYADSESAAAQQIDTVSSNVGDLSTQVSVQQSSIDGVLGKYGVTVDNNGNIAGFELLNGTGGSSFNVSVDAFNIYSGTTNANVFAVDAGQVKINVPLNGVSGTFTGTVQAGDVTIEQDNITLNSDDFGGGQINFISYVGQSQGYIKGRYNTSAASEIEVYSPGMVRLTSNDDIVMTSSDRLHGNGGDIRFVSTGFGVFEATNNVSVKSTGGSASLRAENDDVFVRSVNNDVYIIGENIRLSPAQDVLVNGFPLATASNTYTKTESDNRYANITGDSFTGAVLSSSTFTGTDFILSSDIILKENVKEYKAKPINIKYKQYNIIGDEETRVGVIAQEIEKDHPEFVRENDNGIKSVSYIDMLMAKVAELEARIKELEHGVTK